MAKSFAKKKVKTKVEGAGLGLRPQLTAHLLQGEPVVNWLELIFDNFRNYGGPSARVVSRLSSCYPVHLHCVGMNLGSCDPLDYDYLKQLKELKNCTQAELISDHLCWTGNGNHYHHDLLPLPFTKESLQHIAKRVDAIQDYLGEKIAIENVSSYLRFSCSEMNEAEFLCQLCQQTDCFLLLDINNVYVNAFNHNLVSGLEVETCAKKYLDKIPKERVRQYHLAGYESHENYLLDSHGSPISNSVWQLFAYALKTIGKYPVSIERDANIPSFDKLYEEVQKAQSFYV